MSKSLRILIIAALAIAVVGAVALKNNDKESANSIEPEIAVESKIPSDGPSMVEIGEPENEPQVEIAAEPEVIENNSASATAPSTDTAVASANPSNSSKPVAELRAPVKQEASKPKQLPTLVELGSDTCTPCKLMVPILEELQVEYKDKLEIVFIDIMKDRESAAEYRVRVIPTQVFKDSNGKEVARHQGFISKDDILATFEKHGITF